LVASCNDEMEVNNPDRHTVVMVSSIHSDSVTLHHIWATNVVPLLHQNQDFIEILFWFQLIHCISNNKDTVSSNDDINHYSIIVRNNNNDNSIELSSMWPQLHKSN